MTKVQRLENYSVALLLLIMATVLVAFPNIGYLIVFLIVSASWFIQSVRLLIYYFTMARFMVGGQRILLKGVIFFDLSILALSVSEIPRILVMIYLVIGMIFINLIDILRALDMKKCGAGGWKYKLLAGIAGIAIAAVCLWHYKSPRLSGYIYAVELVYAAIIRIFDRRNKMIQSLDEENIWS